MKSVINWVSVKDKLPPHDCEILIIATVNIKGQKPYRVVSYGYRNWPDNKWKTAPDGFSLRDRFVKTTVSHWAHYPQCPMAKVRK